MIEQLFLKIVEMSLTAGIVILVVMFVRLLLRRMPKSFTYVLWLVVAFRLVVPFSADTRVSVFNLFPEGNRTERAHVTTENIEGSMKLPDEKITSRAGLTTVKETEYETFPELTKDQTPVDRAEFQVGQIQAEQRRTAPTQETGTDRLVSVLCVVWIAGILTLVSYTILMHVMLRNGFDTAYSSMRISMSAIQYGRRLCMDCFYPKYICRFG